MRIVERGNGRPVVLIHGFGVDHRVLMSLDPVFEAHGDWHRLYVDLPGTAGTPVGDVASSEQLVAAVRQAIVDRLGDEPFALVGNSYGGMVARRLAHDFGDQVRGLAVIAGVMIADHSRRTVPEKTVMREQPDLFDIDPDAATQYSNEAVVQSRAGFEAFCRYIKPGLDTVDQSALERIAQRYSLDSEPEDDAAHPFDRPTLFLCGRQDNVVGYHDALTRIDHYSHGSYVVLDAAGHMVHLEQPELTAAAVTEWLDRMDADS